MADGHTIDEIAAAAREGRLVPLVGAGLADDHASSWSSLRNKLEPGMESAAYEDTLEVMGQHRWEAYDLLDSSAAKDSVVPAEYEALARLRAPLIMTTNFDDLIGNGLTPSVYTFRRADAVLRRLDDARPTRPVVFKLFGSAEDPRGAVLSSEHLYAAIYEDTSFVSALQLIFAKRTVLAIGYALDSPELGAIRSILDEVNSWPPASLYMVGREPEAAWHDQWQARSISYRADTGPEQLLASVTPAP